MKTLDSTLTKSIAVVILAMLLPVLQGCSDVAFTSKALKAKVAPQNCDCAELKATPNPVNAGLINIDQTKKMLVKVTNSGNLDATEMNFADLAKPFIWSGAGSYPGAGTCGPVLKAGESCTLEFEFKPTVAGSYSQVKALTYKSDKDAKSLNLGIQGTAVDPGNPGDGVLVANPNPLDFGSVVKGNTKDSVVFLTNTGDEEVSGIAVDGLAAPYAWSATGSFPGVGDCGTTLAAGESCELGFKFSPIVAGQFSGVLSVTYDTSSSSKLLSVSLTGTAPSDPVVGDANIVASPSVLSFGEVEVSSDNSMMITLTNTGDKSADAISLDGISSPFSWGSAGSFPGGGTCSASLAAGASCTIQITFSPIAVGQFSNLTNLNYMSGSDAKLTSIQMLGAGKKDPGPRPDGALLVADPATLNFGSVLVDGSRALTITLSNAGDVAATEVSVDGLAAPYSVSGAGDCGNTIEPTQSCVVGIRFDPKAVGQFDQALVVNYASEDSDKNTKKQHLGRGYAQPVPASEAVIIATPDYVNFGNLRVGMSQDMTVELENIGEREATGLSLIGAIAPFGWSGSGSYPGNGNCGDTLAAGASCDLGFTYTAPAPGHYSALVAVIYSSNQDERVTPVQLLGASNVEVCETMSFEDHINSPPPKAQVKADFKRYFDIEMGNSYYDNVTAPLMSSRRQFKQFLKYERCECVGAGCATPTYNVIDSTRPSERGEVVYDRNKGRSLDYLASSKGAFIKYWVDGAKHGCSSCQKTVESDNGHCVDDVTHVNLYDGKGNMIQKCL